MCVAHSKSTYLGVSVYGDGVFIVRRRRKQKMSGWEKTTYKKRLQIKYDFDWNMTMFWLWTWKYSSETRVNAHCVSNCYLTSNAPRSKGMRGDPLTVIEWYAQNAHIPNSQNKSNPFTLESASDSDTPTCQTPGAFRFGPSKYGNGCKWHTLRHLYNDITCAWTLGPNVFLILSRPITLLLSHELIPAATTWQMQRGKELLLIIRFPLKGNMFHLKKKKKKKRMLQDMYAHLN